MPILPTHCLHSSNFLGTALQMYEVQQRSPIYGLIFGIYIMLTRLATAGLVQGYSSIKSMWINMLYRMKVFKIQGNDCASNRHCFVIWILVLDTSVYYRCYIISIISSYSIAISSVLCFEQLAIYKTNAIIFSHHCNPRTKLAICNQESVYIDAVSLCAAEAIFCCPTENSHHLKS